MLSALHLGEENNTTGITWIGIIIVILKGPLYMRKLTPVTTFPCTCEMPKVNRSYTLFMRFT